LHGQDVHFKFVSPLHDAIERKQASTFLESSDLSARAMELDPSAGAHLDTGYQLRTALEGIGVEARHMRSEEQVAEILQAQAEQAQREEQIEMAKGEAVASRDAAQAVQAVSQ
jgi:hypothetical protein